MLVKRGATLIELIIYTAIFSTMIASIVLLTRTVNETRARVRTSIILESDLRFVLSRISSYVRAADGITLPATSTGTVLVCSFASSTPAYDPTRIERTNGIVTVQRGSGQALALTSSAVEITALMFTRSTSTPPSVRFSLTGKLRNGSGPTGMLQSVTGTAVLRR